MGWRDAFKPTPDQKFKELSSQNDSKVSEVSEISGRYSSKNKKLFNSDLKYLFEERAVIYEFDGGYSRDEAERLAYNEVLLSYIKDHRLEIFDEFHKIFCKPSVH